MTEEWSNSGQFLLLPEYPTSRRKEPLLLMLMELKSYGVVDVSLSVDSYAYLFKSSYKDEAR